MGLSQTVSGSLGLVIVPPAQGVAHSRVWVAASPLWAPPAGFWIQSSYPTSQRHYRVSTSPLPCSLWLLPNHYALGPSLVPPKLVCQCPLCPLSLFLFYSPLWTLASVSPITSFV